MNELDSLLRAARGALLARHFAAAELYLRRAIGAANREHDGATRARCLLALHNVRLARG